MSASSYERYEAAVNAGREPCEADGAASNDDKRRCPNCSSTSTERRVGPDQQFPGAETPYSACMSCGEKWDDVDTFAARAEMWGDRHKRGLEP